MPYLGDKQREYQRERVRARRKKWLRQMGDCVKCGSDERLEFDHIDPTKKVYHISNMWQWKEERLEKELAKCQVLCHDCHRLKTRKERSKHGYSSYRKRGCRCDICKEAAKIMRRRRYLRTGK